MNEHRKGRAEGYEPTIWISTRKGTDGIEIVVRDNGPGIDEAILDKVMIPFFTTKPPTSARASGSASARTPSSSTAGRSG